VTSNIPSRTEVISIAMTALRIVTQAPATCRHSIGNIRFDRVLTEPDLTGRRLSQTGTGPGRMVRHLRRGLGGTLPGPGTRPRGNLRAGATPVRLRSIVLR
jgi:hypothetical protein